MTKNISRGYLVAHQIAGAFLSLLLIAVIAAPYQAYAQPPDPIVAIHVSELTQALETMPATPPTPTGSGTSGYQWWYTSWHYFVAHESLKEALRSDGTPFVEISDSDIAAGKLRNADGSPRYPILISLAAEAIADNEITPLRDYVDAGGFVLAGSSSFTRNPNGTTRSDFALANEMGVHMASANLANWYLNVHFTKRTDHRLTSHIPNGTLLWSAPTVADQTPWTIFPAYDFHSPHYAWQVVASGATDLADGDSGPLLTVKNYGQGQFIYHGVFQPLIGHGGYDPAMYAYVIYRRAIEWAFESFRLPLVKVSPWPYQYDAAMMARHDLESDQTSIRAIESSAQFEKNLGVKGDYYFSTGALRVDMGGNTAVIASLRNAVSNYGATIGSHNGGLKNPANTSLPPSAYEYWHWGPDEALDTHPPGYANGKAYASASILASFEDIEGWLAGTDNGRTGCGALNNCPRTWVSPFFNSARDDSLDILDQLGSVTMGEQKISPFPHRTLSYKTRGKYYAPISLPASDWYVGTDIAQSTEMGHTSTSIIDAVNFYYNLGTLINIYGHEPSNNGSIQQQYITYGVSKPRLWLTNAVGVSDWWRVRSGVAVTSTFTATGNTYNVASSVAGATDPATAIEIALPKNPSLPIANMSVSLNGTPAGPSNYRTTDYGIKVLVGTTVSDVNVQYLLQADNQPPIVNNDSYVATWNSPFTMAAPGVLINDTDPDGTILTAQLVSGPSHGTLTLNPNGSFDYTPFANYAGSDSFTYLASDGAASSTIATVNITVTATGNVLFSDDFTRAPGAPNPLSPWVNALGTWTVTNDVMQGSSAPLKYAYASYAMPLWTDYAVEARIQFTAGAFGGGLGGRVNPANGAHYGAWVYPDDGSGIDCNVLKLIKFRSWTYWNGTPMQQVDLPNVGTDWRALKMVFNGSRIQVYYEGMLMIDATDNNFDSLPPYLSGGISGDMWTYTSPYIMQLDNVVVNALASNLPPVAVNDTYSTNSNTVLSQAVSGVLANDTDPEGAALTAQQVTGPAHGTLTLNGNGSFTYTPTINYSGSDSFTYTANDGVNSSNIGTVTINVVPAIELNTLSLNPTSVTGGTSSQGAVTISGPAPSGGLVVTLMSDNSSIATVPVSVTVASGSSSATFTITTSAVATSTSATISAVYAGVTKTATLMVNPPAVSINTLSLNPTSVTGGTSSQGTVTISGPAPSGGLSVLLSDNSSAASVPASVTIPSGSSSASFTITTTAVASTTPVIISADYGGLTKTATLTVNPPAVSINTLSLNPTSVTGGTSSQGTVTISGPAPSGGLSVLLSDNSSAATVPASVTIPSGSNSATFTITTNALASATSATISAVYAGVTRTATLTVNPPVLNALSISPVSVRGGSSSQGRVTISGPAPSGGLSVLLSDNSSAASVPASVTIPSGSSSATFTITTTAVASATTATISAVYAGVTRTTTLTVNPPVLSSLSLNPTSVKGGSTSKGTVTLSGPAPSGGVVVSLSDNSTITSLPASITVPSGSTSATFTITTTAVTSSRSVTISAVYRGVTKTATLTVTR